MDTRLMDADGKLRALPELPEPSLPRVAHIHPAYYTAEQMHQYALDALALSPVAGQVTDEMVRRARTAIREFWQNYTGQSDGTEWDAAMRVGLLAALENKDGK